MEQIADSINGLVGVTKQSHQTQQMNILHRRCKELEDTVQALDNLCMELELKMLEESCPRKKKVYRKMLEKEEVQQNRKELEETTQSIHNHQESIVTATAGTATVTATPVAMPCYVNVDGTDNKEDSDN